MGEHSIRTTHSWHTIIGGKGRLKVSTPSGRAYFIKTKSGSLEETTTTFLALNEDGTYSVYNKADGVLMNPNFSMPDGVSIGYTDRFVVDAPDGVLEVHNLRGGEVSRLDEVESFYRPLRSMVAEKDGKTAIIIQGRYGCFLLEDDEKGGFSLREEIPGAVLGDIDGHGEAFHIYKPTPFYIPEDPDEIPDNGAVEMLFPGATDWVSAIGNKRPLERADDIYSSRFEQGEIFFDERGGITYPDGLVGTYLTHTDKSGEEREYRILFSEFDGGEWRTVAVSEDNKALKCYLDKEQVRNLSFGANTLALEAPAVVFEMDGGKAFHHGEGFVVEVSNEAIQISSQENALSIQREGNLASGWDPATSSVYEKDGCLIVVANDKVLVVNAKCDSYIALDTKWGDGFHTEKTPFGTIISTEQSEYDARIKGGEIERVKANNEYSPDLSKIKGVVPVVFGNVTVKNGYVKFHGQQKTPDNSISPH